MLVSIITPTYNPGECFFRYFTAVNAQNIEKEIIIIDNNSSFQFQQSIQAFNPVINRENLGFAKACNMGAKMGKGKYLAFINPDAILPDADILSKIIAKLEAKPEAFMAGARIIGVDGKEQRGSRRNLLTPAIFFKQYIKSKDSYNLHNDPLPEEDCFVGAISGSFMVIAREKYLELGGMDERYFLYFEDTDFCMNIAKKGGKILFIPSIEITHIKSTSDAPKSNVELHKTQSFIKYWKKNFPKNIPLHILVIILAYGRYLLLQVLAAPHSS